MREKLSVALLVVSMAAVAPRAPGGEAAPVWHPVTLDFVGPSASQADDAPNPFLDQRLMVRFTGPRGQRYDVPGFFDGDGRGGAQGNVWRVRFAPDAPGAWRYEASLRGGREVAIDLAPEAGEAIPLEAPRGSLVVSPRDPEAPGFLKWGRLEYVGRHYLKFRDGGFFLRAGTDEPENLLAYAGFANTRAHHHFAEHVADWRPGDPDWGDGQGRGLIGALNYLAERGVNSIYFLTMNVGGDGRDVWPWAGEINPRGAATNDHRHFDLAKLAQWETVFAHAQRRGLCLHVVLNEAEKANKRELDDGELGVERKLYYRELVARFGHHLALQWNLCEEYNLDFDFGPERLRAFADYLAAVDPYDHPITVHSAGDPVEKLRCTFGDARFAMTSIQLNQRPIDEVTEAIRVATRASGRPLPVSLDEFTLDRGQRASHLPVDDAAGHRREKLLPTYLSGGQIEFILEDLLKTDSFKTPERERLWKYLAIAHGFMQELPFWEMTPADSLCSGGSLEVGVGNGRRAPLHAQVLAKRGEVYAVYLPTGEPSATLDLSELHGMAELRWFDPRTGEWPAAAATLDGSGVRSLGAPPSDSSEDWVALVRRARVAARPEIVFPGQHWETQSPREAGLDESKLHEFAARMGGEGCVVRDGRLVHQWGEIDTAGDWASAAKPVLSTLLWLAVQEGRLPSVDAPVKSLGWPLSEKDAAMAFRHLANMQSGYARAEPPGEAYAYNDLAIQLYAQSLERAFGQPLEAALHARLADLELEDGPVFGSRGGRGVSASVRDFARIGWLWLNGGRWKDQQVLDARLVAECLRADVPAECPRSTREGTDDLGIGSYGGGSDQTRFGPGVYGFNFWFNRPLPTRGQLLPGLPDDTFQASGHWGRHSVTVIPSLRLVIAARNSRVERAAHDDPFVHAARTLRLVCEAAGYHAAEQGWGIPTPAIDVSAFKDGANHWYKFRDPKRVIQPRDGQAKYDPAQVTEIAENILLFQRANGGWPKNYDMLAVLSPEQRAAVAASREADDTTFDNYNVFSQIDYLARAADALDRPEWRAACERGLDHLFAAELPGGGFPQRHPGAESYSAHVTFNDGVMIGILNLLADIAEGAPHWSWLDDARRQQARDVIARGVARILACQIVIEGAKLGWCQQHDPRTNEARPARSFELASLCPQETTGIVRFLIRLPEPSSEVVAAIDAAVAWMRRVQLAGVRVQKVEAPPVEYEFYRSEHDVAVVADPEAGPLWARHYEIGTDRPVFAGRDAVKRYALAEIERERRTGTPWYGTWPQDLLTKEYPRWKQRHP